MKLGECAFLADENIHPGVVDHLRRSGLDVLRASEAGLQGADDVALMQRALADGRLLLTHDRDFGRLAMVSMEAMIGIVYLRPGHIDPAFTISSISALMDLSLEVRPPFMVVADRSGQRLNVRIRQL